MNHFVFSAFLACLTAVPVGLFFLTRRSFLEKLFGIYWLFIGYWSSTVAFQQQFLKVMPDAIWGWLLHLGCVLIPAIFLHFAVVIANQKRSISLVGYLISFLYIGLNTFTRYFTEGTSYRDAYAYPTPSTVYPVYFVTFVIMVSLGTFFIFHRLIFIKGVQTKWAVIFLSVHLLAYIGAMDNFFIMADLLIFPWYPYGLYFVFIYALVGGHAMKNIFLDLERTR